MLKVAGMLILMTGPALGHTSVQTWSYPTACCGGHDCREVVPPQKVSVDYRGFTVPSGEVVGYGDGRLKESKDEFYHWCTLGGSDSGGTICLFVPPFGL